MSYIMPYARRYDQMGCSLSCSATSRKPRGALYPCGNHQKARTHVTALVTILLWFSALGCGLLAGVYFAFSAFVMTALVRSGQANGVAAMNAINSTILRSLFMPLFFGTTLSSAALAVVGFVRSGEPASASMLVGGVAYVLGMFGVTMFFNVPLNNVLGAADPASAEGAPIWHRYVREWTLWNHVRTVACLAATALFIAAITSRSPTL
jgi:uncharacterized membrane protein